MLAVALSFVDHLGARIDGAYQLHHAHLFSCYLLGLFSTSYLAAPGWNGIIFVVLLHLGCDDVCIALVEAC
jgi:hypothetical protein